MKISMTDFAAGRHFDNPNFGGTKIPISTKEFMDALDRLWLDKTDFVDGYAPFCKHLFVENFTGCLSGVVEITDKNMHLVQSEYEARCVTELPVLVRYFSDVDVEAPPSKYLDIILYSADQLKAEGEEIDGDWGIVSINTVSSPAEDPMSPITMMRNALGKEQGGSGVPLDAKEYERSVKFWSTHAVVR